MNGFSLAELLIALMILAEIATFTIPKVLTANAKSQHASVSKEVAAMVSGSFLTYQHKNSIASTTKGSNLTQYMNYIALDTATTYAGSAGTPLQQCSPTLPCLTLHNGAVLQYDTVMSMGGTASTNAVYFNVDPDGNGSQGRITFIQFSNGRLSSGGQGGTASPSGGTLTRQATDPTYFSW